MLKRRVCAKRILLIQVIFRNTFWQGNLSRGGMRKEVIVSAPLKRGRLGRGGEGESVVREGVETAPGEVGFGAETMNWRIMVLCFMWKVGESSPWWPGKMFHACKCWVSSWQFWWTVTAAESLFPTGEIQQPSPYSTLETVLLCAFATGKCHQSPASHRMMSCTSN